MLQCVYITLSLFINLSPDVLRGTLGCPYLIELTTILYITLIVIKLNERVYTIIKLYKQKIFTISILAKTQMRGR